MLRPFSLLIPLALLSLLSADPSLLFGQQKPKDLQWTHAFDLACRKYGESDFSDKTQKFGVEAFRDNNNDLGLYISQAGALGAGKGFANLKLPFTSKGPEWLTGLDLPARKAGEKEFTKSTQVYSMEVFRDPNTDNWIYITDKGYVAVAPAKSKGAGNQAPKWSHSVDLMVRKGGVKDWKEASKVGIEVYRDANTGNLIYISDIGGIAVIPETAPVKGDGKAPEWLHGLDLACRRANEPSFSKETRKYGVEVFLDANNGNLILICESGHLAVIPGPKDIKAPTPGVKEPQWTHGLNLKVRKAGEKEFSNTTPVFGAEAFVDPNLNAVIYVTERGTISAAAK
ncbi:MAG: hypothetical protein HY040_24535 [Planctomycetes bacterium]|nr:hypothetical protein [Planctomycetota bacterium]